MVEAICDEANVSFRRVARGWVELGATEIGSLRDDSEGANIPALGIRPSGSWSKARCSGASLLTRKQFSSGTRSRVGGTQGPTPQRCLTGRIGERARRYKKGAAKPGLCLVRFVGGGERSGAASSRAGNWWGDWLSVRLVSWRAWSAAREGASSKATDRDVCGWLEVRSVSGGIGEWMAALRSLGMSCDKTSGRR